MSEEVVAILGACLGCADAVRIELDGQIEGVTTKDEGGRGFRAFPTASRIQLRRRARSPNRVPEFLRPSFVYSRDAIGCSR